MNIRQIEALKAIMESGSITRAASRLRISQPSVSKHLKKLEADLEVPLFERSGKKLIPLPEAHALFDQIGRVYLGLEHLVRFSADLKHQRRTAIAAAVVPIVAERWLPDAITRFLAEYDNVSISAPVRSSQWIVDCVSSARVDFGVSLLRSDNESLSSELLIKLPLIAALPVGHAMVKIQKLSWPSLSGKDLITLSNYDGWKFIVQTMLDAQHVRPRRVIDTFSPLIACELAMRGAGIAIVDGLTALDYPRKRLCLRRLEPERSIDVVLLKPRRRPLSPAAKCLSEKIITCARQTEERLASGLSSAGLI